MCDSILVNVSGNLTDVYDEAIGYDVNMSFDWKLNCFTVISSRLVCDNDAFA